MTTLLLPLPYAKHAHVEVMHLEINFSLDTRSETSKS